MWTFDDPGPCPICGTAHHGCTPTPTEGVGVTRGVVIVSQPPSGVTVAVTAPVAALPAAAAAPAAPATATESTATRDRRIGRPARRRPR